MVLSSSTISSSTFVSLTSNGNASLKTRAAARLPSQQHTAIEFQPILLDVRHYDDRTSGLEQRGFGHVIVIYTAWLGLHEHAETKAPAESRQDCGRDHPQGLEQAMLGGNQAASSGRIETFYRGSSAFSVSATIAWNFLQPT